MNKIQLLIGILCLIVAAILALVGVTEITPVAGSTTVAIYPAAFLALLGGIQVFRALFKPGPR